jgi:hypothetical protein
MEFEQAPHKAEEYRKKQDEMRQKLSQVEDEVTKIIATIFESGGDSRWIAIGRTQVELGFMALKRGVYDGKRVGDP